MRHRIPDPGDIEGILEVLEANGCYQLRGGYGAFHRQVLTELLEWKNYRVGASYWEKEIAPNVYKPWCTGLGVFVHDWFYESLREGGGPLTTQQFFDSWQKGKVPALTARELAEANGTQSLNLFIVYYAQRYYDVFHPDNEELRRMGPGGWIQNFQGYNTQRMLWELFGEQHHRYIEAMDMRQVLDYAGHTQREFYGPARASALYELDRSVLSGNGFQPLGIVTFAPTTPRFEFTPAQQRTLFLALQGLTDQEIANSDGISHDAVRNSWQGIYMRCEAALLPPQRANTQRRGSERRRVVLEYVRSHLEEIRPYKKPAA